MVAIHLCFYSLLRYVAQNRVSSVGLFSVSWFWSFSVINFINFFPGFHQVFFSIPTNVFRFISITLGGTLFYFLDRDRKRFAILTLAAIFMYPITYIISTSPDDSLGLSTNIGSLHTGKYTYFSEYIKSCMVLPNIRHNTGQSNVSAVLSHMSGTNSELNLMGTLAFSKVSIAALIYFFSHSYIKLNHRNSLVVMLVTTTGTFSLSLSYLLLHDSGNPILLNGYSDVIFGIFSLILASLLLVNRKSDLSWKLLFLLVPIQLTLLISSPQIFLLFLLLFLLLFFKRSYLKFALINVCSVLIALLTWRNLTGILAFGPPDSFPFIPKPDYQWLNKELISPGIPYMIGSPGMPMSEISPLIIDLFKMILSDADPQRIFWYFEIAIMTTIKVLFWPSLGLLLGLCILLSYKCKSLSKFLPDRTEALKSLAILSTCSFAVMFPITLLFKIGGMKWETTRFAFPVYVLLMLLLSSTLLKMSGKSRFAWLVFSATTILPTVIFVGLVFVNAIPGGLITVASTQFGDFSLFGDSLTIAKCLR